MGERWRWWEDYEPEDGRLVVIGHHWRRLLTEVNPRVYEKYPDGFTPTGADMFPGLGPADLLGPARKVMCVDYAVCDMRSVAWDFQMAPLVRRLPLCGFLK